MRLTAKERILLHLLDFTRFAEAVEVPPEMTQEGIAEAAWIDVPHVSQYVRPLQREGLVRMRTAHVKGNPRRRKVYDLTESGMIQAARLRQGLRSEVVRVRDAKGVRDAQIGPIIQEAGGKFTALEILRRARLGEAVDLTAPPKPAKAFVEMSADAPRVAAFVGRRAELDLLTGDGGPRLIVVRGIAGIGKTSLAGKACDLLRGERNLFWHRVQPWDTVASLLADVGRFLAALGRPGLGAVLARAGPDRAAQVFREDLPGTQSFLVFDDAHEASPEAMPFFRLLKEVVDKAPDVRAAVLTRRALPFYDRRDIALRRAVLELELTGLAPEEVAGLLPAAEGKAATDVGRQVGGHPLFFELVRSHPTPSRALGDLRRFMEEQIYRELAEAQRAMMKLASLYRMAVPREAFFFGPSLTHDVLLYLTERSLIRHVGEERFIVHDTIRDFFAGLLTSMERHDLGSFAIAELRALAGHALAGGNAITAMGALANALELATEDPDRIALYEAFGDATEKVGDLPGALVAYQKALDVGPASETVVRLHRKAAAAFEDRGDIVAALAALNAAVEALGDEFNEERGWVYVLRCVVARDTEELEEAREYGEEALRVFRALGVPRGEAEALIELGYIDYFAPDRDAALSEKSLRSALAIAERLGDPGFLAKVRIVLANVVAYDGWPEEGLSHVAAVESTPAAMSDPRVRRSCLEMKGMVHMLLDSRGAEAALTESIVLARKMRDLTTETIDKFALGVVALNELRLDEARPPMEAAARELKAQGLPGVAVEVHFFAALAPLFQGDLEGFRALLASLDDPRLSRGLETRYPRVQALRGIERLLEGDEAGVHEAFTAALRSERMQWAYFSHLLYGAALRAMGQEEKAQEHLDRARDLARTNGWKVAQAVLPEMEKRLVDVLSRAWRAPHPRRRKSVGKLGETGEAPR